MLYAGSGAYTMHGRCSADSKFRRCSRLLCRTPQNGTCSRRRVATCVAALAPKPSRADLDAPSNALWPPNCSTTQVLVPTYPGPGTLHYALQNVPKLDKTTIQQTKAAAISKLNADVQNKIKSLKTVNSTSGFTHPGDTSSAAELALLQDRVNKSVQPQVLARDSLLSGQYYAYQNGITKPKSYSKSGTTWVLPAGCPADYGGPYPAAKVSIGYSGVTDTTKASCPANLPKEAIITTDLGANKSLCQHVAWVELDSGMAYRQAVAFHATGDARYADNALRIIQGWADTNKSWDLIGQNGPLEAGWGIAAMARALELLRSRPQFASVRDKFLAWVVGNSSTKGIMMAQLDHYIIDTLNKVAAGQAKNMWGNWHTSIIQAKMATAILADDKAAYDKAKELFHMTVRDYLWKWGRDPNFAFGRLVGEMTETLRDLFHTQFGLAGLIGTAELAWQQDEDLYSSNDYAIVTAMEFHARIIRAALEKNYDLLPPGCKLLDFSKPPFNAAPWNAWTFDIKEQVWQSTVNGQTNTLNDPTKYMRDISYLSVWEVGYNHYVGRLGMRLPETAAIIKMCWPEWQEFHWGLGSLTHGDTAAVLWRAGIAVPTSKK